MPSNRTPFDDYYDAFGPPDVTTMALSDEQLDEFAALLKAAVERGSPLTRKEAAEFDAPAMAAVASGKVL